MFFGESGEKRFGAMELLEQVDNLAAVFGDFCGVDDTERVGFDLDYFF